MHTPGRGSSKKYLLLVVIVLLLFVLSLTVLFTVIMRDSYAFFRENLLVIQGSALTEKTIVLMDGIGQREQDLAGILKAGDRIFGAEAILGAAIYARSADDNYFTFIEKKTLHSAVVIDIPPHAAVADRRVHVFMGEGLLRPVVEPRLYVSGNASWRHVYFPHTLHHKKHVVQLMISSNNIHTALRDYGDYLDAMRLRALIGALIVIVGIGGLALVINQNFSRFVRGLSDSISRAARGELALNIERAEEEGLSELALSLNSLVDEIREKHRIIQDYENKDIFDSIFKTGVAFLKENKLDEAETIFQSLIILKPHSFGSYFNLGIINAKRSRYQESIDLFGRALQCTDDQALTLQYIEKVKRLKENHDPGTSAPLQG